MNEIIKKIITICENILEDKVRFLEKTQELADLIEQLNTINPDFLEPEIYGILLDVNFEAKDLPIDQKTRINWNAEALKEKDDEIKKCEEKWSDAVRLACKSIKLKLK